MSGRHPCGLAVAEPLPDAGRDPQRERVPQSSLAVRSLPGEALLEEVIASLTDDKAEEVVTIDLRGKTQMADQMVIASGRSSRQVAAISEKLVQRLKDVFGLSTRSEGKEAGDWVLIDAGDVIVHLFRAETRSFYDIERLWQMTPPPARPPAAGGDEPS